MSRRRLLLTLYLTVGLGNRFIYQIMEEAKKHQKDALTAEEVVDFCTLLQPWQKEKIKQAYQKAQQEKTLLENLLKTPFITYWDQEYPVQLKEMYQFPVLLFYRGNLSLLKENCLGVVGCRSHLNQREEILEKILSPLLKEVVIVSGLAKGTDASSHRLCLKEKGKTIGVLGTGLDIVYPKEHRLLQQEVGEKGLLISEYLPFAGPKRHHFPMRNRIIAGLCSGVIVLGAKERSGSLITADWALEHNKEIFAIPGSILDKNYAGSLRLIQQGAKCVTCSEDIFEELNFVRKSFLA